LKNKFGFDNAFNYKEEHDLDAALKRSSVRVSQVSDAFKFGFMMHLNLVLVYDII
jgi:hypothetical protein